jgi:hypothetical protein
VTSAARAGLLGVAVAAGLGLGRTRAAASADAMKDCGLRGTKGCETRYAVCSR